MNLPKWKKQKPLEIGTQNKDPDYHKKRNPYCIIIVGTNGTGKTTFCRKRLNVAFEKGKRILIIAPTEVGWEDIPLLRNVESLSTMPPQSYALMTYRKDLLTDISEHFESKQPKFNGVIVLDDFKGFGMKTADEEVLRQFLIQRRQRQFDIFVVAHGLTDITPRIVFNYTNYIVLFKTTDNLASISHVVPNFENVRKVKEEVDKKAEKEKHYQKIAVINPAK